MELPWYTERFSSTEMERRAFGIKKKKTSSQRGQLLCQLLVDIFYNDFSVLFLCM